MEKTRLKELLEEVAKGKVTPEEAYERLQVLPFEDIGFAKIDHHRNLRRGVPEVIFCEGKKTEEIVRIARVIIDQGVNLIATRCSVEQFEAVAGELPQAQYYEEAKLFVVEQDPVERKGNVAVVSAGTSDRRVAEEAALCAYYLGANVERIYDVGVAGIHRLFSEWERIRGADVVIVVAGMEGALASVVGGIVESPVIAVPTSVGYGASFNGLSALLTMLNSCAGGVTVVNIDNGFGAGYAAANIIGKIYESGSSRSKEGD